MNRIPYGRQCLSEADKAAVMAVLESDWLTQGPAVPQFEEALSRYCQSSYCVAVNSATSALHLACMALDVGSGDEVWTSPNTFVASANCARYCGAAVDFVDIDPTTYNMCPRALAEKLASRSRAGQALPKVLIVVHFAGQPCDMTAIAALASQYDFRIIEDASHAVGAWQYGKPIGSCEYSDITVFSFHPVKIITCGEGGAALTHNASLYESMSQLRTHGVVKPPVDQTAATDGPWIYEQQALGYNYRMTDIQAALGLSQLSQLDAFVARRHQLADQYDSALMDTPLQLPQRNSSSRSALHLYPVLVPCEVTDTPDDVNQRKLQLYQYLTQRGIGVNVHYIPVHTQPYYRELGFGPGDFPVAEHYYRRELTIPLFSSMTDEQQNSVIESILGIHGSIEIAA